MNLNDYLPKDNQGGKKSGGGDKQRYRDYVIKTQEEGNVPLTFEEWMKLQNG